MTDLGTELIGTSVVAVRFGPSFTIEFSGSWELYLGREFEIQVGDRKLPLDLRQPTEAVLELVKLRRQVVSAITIEEADASILVRFDHVALRAEQQYAYESWILNGPNGEKIIAMPTGGGLAEWGPREDD